MVKNEKKVVKNEKNVDKRNIKWYFIQVVTSSDELFRKKNEKT